MIGIEQRHELIGSRLGLREGPRECNAVGIELNRAARGKVLDFHSRHPRAARHEASADYLLFARRIGH